MKLYIDDERPAPEGWTKASSYDMGYAYIVMCANEITEISFDHDLGDCFDRSGYDLLKLVEDMFAKGEITKLPIMHVHTANVSVRDKMVLVIERLKEKSGN